MTGVLTLEADRIAYEAGVAVAEGHVRLAWEDQVLTGDTATVDGRTITFTHGTWRRGGELLTFDTATVDVDTKVGALGALRAEVDGATVEADQLRVQADGRWELDGGRVEPCACPDGGRPALTFRAAHAEVVPGRAVVLRGGTVRVFEVPVLPVPYWRILLDRDRFHLLFPELSYGDDGVGAWWEGEGTVDGWTIRGGPAFLQDRGLRAVASTTGPLGTASGELGWDWAEARVRGIGVTKGGWDGAGSGSPAPPRSALLPTRSGRFAWDVAVASDAAYADDYAVDYVARGVAWRESRAVAEWGPFRVLQDVPNDESVGTLVAGRARWEFGRRRAYAVAPRVEVAAVGGVAAGEGTESAESGLSPGVVALAGIDWRVAGTTAAGVLHGELSGDAGVQGLLAGDPFAPGPYVRADARLDVPMWGELAGWRIQAWVGGFGSVDVGAAPASPGESSTYSSGDGGGLAAPFLGVDGFARIVDPPPMTYAGPSVRAEAIGDGGVIRGEAVAGWSEVGFSPRGTLTVRTGPLQTDLRADRRLQSAQLSGHFGVVSPSVGAVRLDGDVVLSAAPVPDEPTPQSDLLLTWADLDVHPGRLRVGGGLSWDFEGAGFSGAMARLGYDDGCSSALLTAAFSPDRAVPTVGLKATLRR